MRLKLLSIFVTSLLIVSCSKNEKSSRDLKILPDITTSKDESIKTKELIADFDEIEVSQAIDAEIIKADHEKVVILAPATVIDEIIIEQKGTSLSLHYKAGVRVTNGNKVKAKIYLKDFSKLSASSGAVIRIKDQFTQEKVDIEASSSGEISGHLEANKMDINLSSSGSFKGKIWAIDLEVDASSSGLLEVSGKAKNISASASSGSDVNMSQISTETAKLEASSGSDISAGVISYLETDVSSGASINVKKLGEVKIGKQESGSGGSVTFN